jgi:PAS domain S-box-containing protein
MTFSSIDMATVLDNIGHGVVMFDSKQCLAYWNQQYEDLMDYPKGFLKVGISQKEMTLPFAERGAFGPGDPEQLTDERVKLVWGNVQMMTSLEVGHGKFCNVHLQKTDSGCLVASYTDVTEQLHAEEALRLSEERYALIAAGSNDGLWDWNIRTNKLFISSRMEELLGYKADEIENDYSIFENARHPEDARKEQQAFETHLADQTPYEIDYRLRHKDGHYVWVSGKGQAVWDTDGTPLRMAGSLRDITDRKAAEAALQRSHETLEKNVAERTADLAKSEERLSLSLRSGAIGTFSWNIKDDSHFWDDRNHQIWGLTPDSGSSDHVIDFDNSIHPDDVELVREASRRTLEDDQTYDLEFRIVKPDGNIAHIHQAATLVRDSRGQPDTLIGVNHDISERNEIEQKLRDSETRFRSFYDVVPDMFVIAEMETLKFVDVNEGFCRLTGYSKDDAIGKSAAELNLFEVPQNRLSLLAELEENDRYENVAVSIKNRDGTIWPGIASASIIEIDNRRLVLASIKDISEIRRSQMEAIAANQAKSTFLSSMSHEFRTPLNAIFGFSQLLQSDDEHPLDEDQQHSLSYIIDNSQHMMRLIDDILDLSKIELNAVMLEVEDVSTAAVLDDCVATLALTTAARNIHIDIIKSRDRTSSIRADKQRLKQVLLNILSNAVKYNHDGGGISVRIEDPKDDMQRVEISDTGNGISKDKQHELFQPFKRLGAETSNIEGTGIGLFVCKGLIERMGGTIGVESEVGKGSTFWFTLPASKNNQENRIELTKSDPTSSADGTWIEQPRIKTEDSAAELNQLKTNDGTKKVLYIEDNPSSQQMMEKVFKRLSAFELAIAKDAETGLALAEQGALDLILLDINLPGMDGYEAITKLGEMPHISDVPVIGLSANAMPHDIEKAMQAGFTDYLTKPVSISVLLEVIKKNVLSK